MDISIYNHKVYVDSYTDSELEELKKACKLHYFRGRNKDTYDKTTNLLFKNELSFPTGALNFIADRLDKKGIDLDYVDHRTSPSRSIKLKKVDFEFEDRNWQKEAFEKTKQENTGVIIAPTGDGKSRIIDRIIEHKKVRTLIVVPLREQQDDTYFRLKAYWGNKVQKELRQVHKRGFSVNDYKADYNGIHRDESFITEEEEGDSIETLYLKSKGYGVYKGQMRRVREMEEDIEEKLKVKYPEVLIVCRAGLNYLPVEYLESVEMIILEEGHTMGNESARIPLSLAKNAGYRYTITATYIGESKESLLELIATTGNNVIYEETYQEARDEGNIKDINYHVMETSPPMNAGRVFKSSKVKGDNIIKKLFVGNESRNKDIVNLAIDLLTMGRSSIIFVTEEAHAHILENHFAMQGIDVSNYFRRQDEKEKEKIKEMAKNSDKPFIIIGTPAIGMGTDTRMVNSIILGDIRKSMKRVLQNIGRGLRKAGKFNTVDVYDFQDTFNQTTYRWFTQRKETIKKYYFEDGSFTRKIAEDLKVQLNFL